MQTLQTGMSETKAARFVADGRCPLCGTRLRKVTCECVRGGFFGRPHKRSSKTCIDCGGLGYSMQCPADHKLLEVED
jgi:uncharacterized protein with PIN domain